MKAEKMIGFTIISLVQDKRISKKVGKVPLFKKNLLLVSFCACFLVFFKVRVAINGYPELSIRRTYVEDGAWLRRSWLRVSPDGTSRQVAELLIGDPSDRWTVHLCRDGRNVSDFIMSQQVTGQVSNCPDSQS